jgi:hypothetical protein
MYESRGILHLNAVNMVFGSFIDKLFGVINHQMLTKALQGLIASLLGSRGNLIVNEPLRVWFSIWVKRVCAETDSTTLRWYLDPTLPSRSRRPKTMLLPLAPRPRCPSYEYPQSRTHPSQSHPRA